MLVYDITKQETFEDLPKWMKMIDKVTSTENMSEPGFKGRVLKSTPVHLSPALWLE